MSALEQAIPEGYKQTDIGIFPDDWSTKYLGDICNLINGRGFKPFEWNREGLPIIRIQNLNGSDEYNYYDGHYNPKILIKNGQLLFAWSGSRGTSFGPHIWYGENALLNYHTWKMEITDEIEPNYFFHALKVLTKTIEDSAHGASALVHTQMGEMKKFIVPIPVSINEQTAIANALSDVDALLTELEKLIAKKQAIKTATMQQLLTGKTRLPQFATYTEGEIQSHPKCTKPSELGEIPEDWDVYAIGALFSITAGGDLRKNQFSPIKTDKHPYPIYSNAITNKGLYGYCSTFDYDGECLTITARGGIGHAVERDGSFCAIGRLLVLSPKQNTNCKYVAEFANQYIEFANESTGVPQLTAPQVAKYSIAMPVFEEQTAIATILSDMDNEIQTLEQRLAKTRQIKQGMMQELLTGRTRLPFDKNKEA